MSEKKIGRFAAIDKAIQVHIPSADDVTVSGKEWVLWGEDNHFPAYEMELYENVSSLKSIIDGSVDFTVGNAIAVSPELTGILDGVQARADVGAMSFDWYLHHAMALQVIRAIDGTTVQACHCPIRFLRWNKERSVFFYSEHWDDKKVRNAKVLTYPAFMPGGVDGNSILLVVAPSFQTYPIPIYRAALRACEIERSIDEYHLSEISNGFSSSAIINFNNGVPGDEEKDEIERNVQEKFAGKRNGGRIMLSWNDSLANRATVDQFSVQDFGAKYDSLAKHSRQQIFTAFRATPNLFGIPTETTGFNEQEYASAFKLYNRVTVSPVQASIVDMYDTVFGVRGSLTFTPFSLDGTTTKID